MTVTAQYAPAQERYEKLKASGLNLDLTRGKPSEEQLMLSLPMLDIKPPLRGIDRICNYGSPEGLPEAREMFAAFVPDGDLARFARALPQALRTNFTEAMSNVPSIASSTAIL